MGKKYLVGTAALNEGIKIQEVIKRCNNYQLYDLLIIDDGSTDGSLSQLDLPNSVTLIRNEKNKGAGYCVRKIMQYGIDNGYEASMFISGNNKDDPEDIKKLIVALESGADFVQGSRYLPGGKKGKMPFYRIVATKYVYPIIFSLMSGQKITDCTNGFRAIRSSFLKDERMDIHQEWLDRYELEPYLFFKAIKLGYNVVEVPVTKIYPPKTLGYTKMKPFSGWWSILRPMLYLGLGIKK